MRGPRKRNEDDGNDYDVNSGFAAEGWSSRCASRPLAQRSGWLSGQLLITRLCKNRTFQVTRNCF